MCGLPGYGPGDLIDLSFEGDRVRVTFTAGMVRPLRLTTDEAVALVVALRTLLELPGLAERRGGQPRAGQGLGGRRARGRPGHAGRGQRRRPRGGARRRPRRRWSASGRCTCTTTCPPGTSAPSGPSTRCGCCSSTARGTWRPGAGGAEGVRLFRLDRVDDVVVLDEPAAPPPQAHERDVDNGVYQPEPGRAGGAAAAGPQRPLGRRLLPGRRRSTPLRPTAGWRSPCAPPTWPGPAGWWPRSAARPRVDEPAELADQIAGRRPGGARPVRRRRTAGAQRRRLGSRRGGADRVDRRRGPRPRRPRGDRRTACSARPAGCAGSSRRPSATCGRCSTRRRRPPRAAAARANGLNRPGDPRADRIRNGPSGVASPVPPPLEDPSWARTRRRRRSA